MRDGRHPLDLSISLSILQTLLAILPDVPGERLVARHVAFLVKPDLAIDRIERAAMERPITASGSRIPACSTAWAQA